MVEKGSRRGGIGYGEDNERRDEAEHWHEVEAVGLAWVVNEPTENQRRTGLHSTSKSRPHHTQCRVWASVWAYCCQATLNNGN